MKKSLWLIIDIHILLSLNMSHDLHLIAIILAVYFTGRVNRYLLTCNMKPVVAHVFQPPVLYNIMYQYTAV